MEKTTMLQGNEDVKTEMEKILWTPVLNDEEVNVENTNVVIKDTKTPENKVEIPTENQENVESTQKTTKTVKKERKPKSTGQTKKPASGEWINNIPEDQKLVEGDILYCIGGDGKGKFAKVIGYGKKENIVWANMFKKNSNNFMNRPWSLTLKDTVIVYKNGQLTPGYSVNEEGIYSKDV